MKTTTLLFFIFGVILCTACGNGAPASQDQQLIYAQQTLDALNAGVGQNQSIATTVPQSNNVQPTATAVPQSNFDQATATSIPQTNGDAVAASNSNSVNSTDGSTAFAGAVGQWESLDSDLSYQTLTFDSNADGSYSFRYIDQGASTCGLDANNKPINAMTFSGTGMATNNVLNATQVQGICEGTGKTIVVALQYSYQADSNTIVDGSGTVWKQNNGASGSLQSEPTGERINLLVATDGTINFPANQAFHIEHGWSYDAGNSAQSVFTSSNFSLFYDNQALPLDTIRVIPDDSGNAGSINWVYNFPNGLTGTHSFIGIWTATCADMQPAVNCDDPSAMMEADRLAITINFTP